MSCGRKKTDGDFHMRKVILCHLGRAVVLAIVSFMLALDSPARADWPQYLGPNRNGIGPDDQGLARSWPATGPKVLWRVVVGEGFAGPAIQGGSVFILDREADEWDVLRRINLVNGNEIWRYRYRAPGRLDRNGSRTTPATDGRLVFSVGPFGHVHALRCQDGSEVWDAHLLHDWNAERPGWGVSQSPLLSNDQVIVAPWGQKAAVVAYDKASGQVLWRTANPKGVTQDYSSPIPMQMGLRDTIVASGKNGFTIGVDARSGQELWSFDGYKCRIHIPSPTVLNQQRVLLTGGYGAGAVMFRVAALASNGRTLEVWKDRKIGSKIAQSLFYKGNIYAPSGDTRGILRCLRPDGRVRWESGPHRRFAMGSLIIVDGLLFIVHGDTGELVMAEADPNEYRELGRSKTVLESGKIWAPLAYSDGKLVIRDEHHLVCVDLKSAGP